MSSNPVVRTRMAPSPTGEYHIGHLRTLLYNYAFAKKHHGQFIIRIEDTDRKRFVTGAADRILQVIKDYGLSWDEGPDIGGPYGPYVQTQRLDIYQKYIQQLLDQNQAYYCFCTEDRLQEMRTLQKANNTIPKYDRHCLGLTKKEIAKNLKNGLPFVIRLRVPDHQTITFTDAIRGQISFNTDDLDDQILVKSNGIPTYHFAVVVDDHLMKISHVLRGDEWISSVPKQILLYRYFDWELPVFAHLPVFLDPSGKGKMSKRRGSVSARSFLTEGYLPEALLNFLMLLGWNPGDDREFFTLDRFIEAFSLEHLHKKQPIFDRKKLDYFNGYYLRQKSNEQLALLLKPYFPKSDDAILLAIAPLIKERISTLSQAVPLTNFIFESIDYDKELLLPRGLTPELARNMINQTLSLLDTRFPDRHCPPDKAASQIQTMLLDLIKTNSWNTGQFFMVFRIAIAGSPVTPPIVDCLPILGKERTINRLQNAFAKLFS